MERLRESEFSLDWNPEVDADGPVDFHYRLIQTGSEILLSLNGSPEECPQEPDEALRVLGNRIHLTIAEYAEPEVFVHAGAVLVDGRAIVLPGRSYAGKSTLTLALIERGATLLSDDFAVLDANGDVRAYPVPVSQRLENGRRRLQPEQLGWKPGQPPVPIAIVALCIYFERLQELDLKSLQPPQAVLAMLEHTVAARRAPARCMSTLAKAVSGARCWRGLRREAGPVADWLLERLRES